MNSLFAEVSRRRLQPDALCPHVPASAPGRLTLDFTFSRAQAEVEPAAWKERASLLARTSFLREGGIRWASAGMHVVVVLKGLEKQAAVLQASLDEEGAGVLLPLGPPRWTSARHVLHGHWPHRHARAPPPRFGERQLSISPHSLHLSRR
jgi:hypothetical protein